MSNVLPVQVVAAYQSHRDVLRSTWYLACKVDDHLHSFTSPTIRHTWYVLISNPAIEIHDRKATRVLMAAGLRSNMLVVIYHACLLRSA